LKWDIIMREDEALNKSEWMVVLTLILLMGMLTFVSHRHWLSANPISYSNSVSITDLEDSQVHVWVEGAVERPGGYHVAKGSKIQDVLLLAKPAQNADLKKISPAKKIKEGQVIKIPRLEYLTIYLEGAVDESGPLIVPKGTTRSDLLSLVHFKKEADLEQLKSKKRLKEGERVVVLFQKTASLTVSEHEFAIRK
jgi:hypothetical protein